jgi:hypothetical protein
MLATTTRTTQMAIVYRLYGVPLFLSVPTVIDVSLSAV